MLRSVDRAFFHQQRDQPEGSGCVVFAGVWNRPQGVAGTSIVTDLEIELACLEQPAGLEIGVRGVVILLALSEGGGRFVRLTALQETAAGVHKSVKLQVELRGSAEGSCALPGRRRFGPRLVAFPGVGGGVETPHTFEQPGGLGVAGAVEVDLGAQLVFGVGRLLDGCQRVFHAVHRQVRPAPLLRSGRRVPEAALHARRRRARRAAERL